MDENVILTFVQGILDKVTSTVPLTTVAAIIGAIIAAGLVPYFAWKFGRKGFAFIRNALAGRGAKI